MFVYSWRDIIEILFFSASVYYVSRWLYYDKTKPLLRYFYGFLGILFITHITQLSAISSALALSAPIIGLLFIIMHQESLQRNIIALKAFQTPQELCNDWLDVVMRSCLLAINSNKPIQFLIEHTDSVDSFMHAPYQLNAPASLDLLSLLIEHPLLDTQGMMWLNNNGTIKGINCVWKEKSTNEEQTTALYSEKTDCLLIKVQPQSNTLLIIYDGKTYSDVSVHQAVSVLKKNHQQKEKGTFNAHFKKSTQPRHPSA